MPICNNRKIIARAALESLRDCPPEYFAQRMDAWLSHATPAEVRKNWRKSWRWAVPGWAR